MPPVRRMIRNPPRCQTVRVPGGRRTAGPPATPDARRAGRRASRSLAAAGAVLALLGTAACAGTSPAGGGTSSAVLAGATGSAAATTTTPSAPSVDATPQAATATLPGAPTASRPAPGAVKPARWNEPGAYRAAPVVRSRRLVGKVVVLDPGHQIGNSRHLAQVNRTVNAGAGVRKACNTTGTQTNGGYPESRVAMRIALAAKKRLEAQGATVRLTRPRESAALWGPCIDARGRFGIQVRADAVVSIHADGAPARDRGFHVIRPASVRGWTDDIAGPSRRLAVAVHGALVGAGQRPARYIGSRDGYDVRRDLGTLNWSDRPICMVELGNMRSAPDAAMLTDPRWQDGVAAAAITAGVVDFLS